jgi:hypothetical protein
VEATVKKIIPILIALVVLIAIYASAATVSPRADAAYRYSTSGQIVSSTRAQVWVYSAGSSTLSTLYLTSAGTTTTTNPVIADSYGNYSYYAIAGFYDEVIVGPAGTTPAYRYNIPIGQLTVVSTITSTPSYTGQFAVSGGNAYMSTGNTATTDWKQIN